VKFKLLVVILERGVKPIYLDKNYTYQGQAHQQNK
jgi:hypothetical protein